MRLRFFVLLILVPLLWSFSCGSNSPSSESDYVTESEFQEYKEREERQREREKVQNMMMLQNHKWLTKVEVEACKEINYVLDSNDVKGNCVEVNVLEDSHMEDTESYKALAIVATLNRVYRCPVLLTWDRLKELHVYPIQPEDGSKHDSWQEIWSQNFDTP